MTLKTLLLTASTLALAAAAAPAMAADYSRFGIPADLPGTCSYEAIDAKDYSGRTLNIITHAVPVIGEPTALHAKQFEELTGAKVSVVHVPFGDLFQRILIPFQTGQNAYDVLFYGSLWIGDLNPFLAAVPDAYRDSTGMKDVTHALKPIWPDDRPHLTITEIADWFAAYVYLPKVRDKVVLEGSIRDAVAKLDPQFGYADGFDEATGKYHKLIWAKNPPEFATSTAMIVREAEAQKQLKEEGVLPPRPEPGSPPGPGPIPGDPTPIVPGATAPGKPKRFYGSVELDMVRPVKSFDAILNAVVMELQRTHGAKVKLTLEIEAEATDGFAEGEVGVVRDNARQLKFKSESTGFEE